MRSASRLWKDEAALASSEGNVKGEVGWIVTALSGVRDGGDPRWAADRLVTIQVLGNHADFYFDDARLVKETGGIDRDGLRASVATANRCTAATGD